MREQSVIRDEIIAAIEGGLLYYELDAGKAEAVYDELTDHELIQIHAFIRKPGYHVLEIGLIAGDAYRRLPEG